ncbi:MAG: AraC family transcriptional regulator, partial [Flavobacteriaceae bacterium]|nr:AraC family transcriptional regulator [Flavobacteriaceae bacterium]
LMQEVAKFYYIREKYDSAYYYYNKFVKIKESNGLNIYPQEDIKIATVYKKMGFADQAQGFFEAYSRYCDRDISIYQPASLAMKYLYEGKQDMAIEQLKEFATRDNFFYWIPLFIEKDPMMKPLKNHPDYKATIKKIDDKFWENHRQLERTLKENDLM